MRDWRVLAALAPFALIVSAPALADDPRDPVMASRSARERDRAIIRKLNQDQLAYVRKRDAGYARGWEDYRRAHGGDDEEYADAPAYGARSYSRDDRRYASARSEYEAAMAEWREDVAACRAGYYEHCAR